MRALIRKSVVLASLAVLSLAASSSAAGGKDPKNPLWWEKYQYLIHNGPVATGGPSTSLLVGGNVDVSNECGPQSETYITINPSSPNILAGGSNESGSSGPSVVS